MIEKSQFLYVVNLKTYPGSWGSAGRKLVSALATEAQKAAVHLIVCVPATDIADYSANLGVTVFAQHVDEEMAGAHTGAILAEAVKEAGASGTLINHSEKRLKVTLRNKTLARCLELGLTTIICAQNEAEAKAAAGLHPDYIAYEPPELIGGEISVAQAKPEMIKDIVDQLTCPVLVGAGINSKEDVQLAHQLGAVGILVASHVVKAADPAAAFAGLII